MSSGGKAPGGKSGGGGGGGGGKKGKLKDDLVRIVYGYGDAKEPVQESVELLERMVHEYVGEMCRQAYEVALMGQAEQEKRHEQAVQRAAQKQKQPPAPPAPREVQTGDFIFLIRKDVRRYKRMKDLLEADEELREARDTKIKKMAE